jgi:hypothetical protein
LVVAVVALDRAEFRDEVLFPADTLARDPRVEEIGPETHLDRDVGLQSDRLLQEPLADIAPRADDVGNHVDGERRGHGRSLREFAGISPER